MGVRQILIVEDDKAIRQGIADALTFEGFATLQAANGKDGMDLALRREYDLLLLDLVLPGVDGLEILEAVRAGRPTQPVIIMTAKGEEDDRVKGLKLGADDYVVKPFSVKEMLARVEAVLRRSPERPSDVVEIRLPDGVADLSKGEIRFDDGVSCELPEREGELLRYLAKNAGRVVSRDELMMRVWRLNPKRVETRTIDVHIGRLREKIRDDAADPKLIITIRGKGYTFKTEDSQE
ncbi:MAG: response regulator transcription factor [Deltaproteobacteria bacterium]|nr:response regulator transcription factor [Deltaproteobacteria bacterium]MBW1872814.1 response regulator transcription factor [Deltaproteobacteria bacterium]